MSRITPNLPSFTFDHMVQWIQMKKDEKSLDQLDLIIEEENRHVRLLEDCLEKRENLTLGTFCVTKP